jgi:hypothetical protein
VLERVDGGLPERARSLTQLPEQARGGGGLQHALAPGGGPAVAIVISAAASVYPAARAARLSPTEALRTL